MTRGKDEPTTRPPAKCNRCQVNRVAWKRPRVDFCYQCLPGGPFTAPPCRKCGSDSYFSEGLCDHCHAGAPHYRDSCRGCLAWGVLRTYGFLCWSCRWWHTHYPIGKCLFCERESRIAEQGACRLCVENARIQQQPGRPQDLAVNGRGQQLFLANMQFQRHKQPRLKPPWSRGKWPRHKLARPTRWQQLTLFDLDLPPELVRAIAARVDLGDLVQRCEPVVAEHAARHGWTNRQTSDVRRSLRLLQVLLDGPDDKIRASDVLQLPGYGGNVICTLDVLDAAGLLEDDRTPQVERYFADKTESLPAPMRAELEVWLRIMLDGSPTAPRRRARDPQTARLQIMGIAPILQAWADAGHQSLAEITHEQLLASLPDSRTHRHLAQLGTRSLFTILKGQKLIFTNPARGMALTSPQSTVPMPIDTAAIRDALNSPNPAVALAVALVAFHALSARQVQSLQLTDITDGVLTVDGRTVPLAGPVRVRLSAWLDHRQRTWPSSINPHLFIGLRTASRLTPVGKQFPWTNTTLRPQALREDRIVHEILDSGGDVRRVCDLFGISVSGAMRYTAALAHPDLERPEHQVPRTRDSG